MIRGKYVLFTDESKFEMFGSKRHQFVHHAVCQHMLFVSIQHTIKHERILSWFGEVVVVVILNRWDHGLQMIPQSPYQSGIHSRTGQQHETCFKSV